ncbi:MAG: DUF1361 domain-containing protein [Chitinophagaceae bacterium]|nr:DUF1361 domain-containing protein [Chitinophagaceae bacterium]
MKQFSFNNTLGLLVLFICSLIVVRVWYTNSMLYVFLGWNIFLAFIPYWISGLLRKTNYPNWMKGIFFGTWLLFFPNALYIITDLIHLKRETIVPVWFDATIIFSSAILGLIVAFISLYRVEEFLRLKLNRNKINIAIPFLLFLGSFGVYLGRFLRWNSWDILQNPIGLISTITNRFIFPLQHLRTCGLTFMLTTLFYLLYLVIKKLPVYI